jgi:hypothetical protein
MHARDLPAFEAGFRGDGLDSSGRRHTLRPLSVPIPGENRNLEVVRLKPADGIETYYTAEAAPKERVALHFTTGYIRGDVQVLTVPKSDPARRVSVAFLIARDGNIYNLFDSRYWAYHLGPTAVGGNTAMSRSSVGVEINIEHRTAAATGTIADYHHIERCVLPSQRVDLLSQSFVSRI